MVADRAADENSCQNWLKYAGLFRRFAWNKLHEIAGGSIGRSAQGEYPFAMTSAAEYLEGLAHGTADCGPPVDVSRRAAQFLVSFVEQGVARPRACGGARRFCLQASHHGWF